MDINSGLQTGITSGRFFCRRSGRFRINFRLVSCVLGSQTFVPLSWMCKKQSDVCHSCAELEIISLGASLRMEGTQALQLWDCVSETFSHSDAKGNFVRPSGERHSLTHSIGHMSLEMVVHDASNIPDHSLPSRLQIFEGNDAIIRMIIKCHSPNLRHVSRTHRVDLDWQCVSESFWTVQFLFDMCAPQNNCVHYHSMEVSDAVD